MQAKGAFKEFAEVVKEYFTTGHAEQALLAEVDSPRTELSYLPMHAVHKEHSTTSKVYVRVVFDASAKRRRVPL